MLRYQLSPSDRQNSESLLAKLSRNGHSRTSSINQHSPYGRQFDNSVRITKAFPFNLPCHLGSLSPLPEICEVADATLQRQPVRCAATEEALLVIVNYQRLLCGKYICIKINLTWGTFYKIHDQLVLKTVKANKTKESLRNCHSLEEPMETWWLM